MDNKKASDAPQASPVVEPNASTESTPTIAALQLGWEMAEAFYAPPPWSDHRDTLKYRHLPSLAELSEYEQSTIRLERLAQSIQAIGYTDSERTPLPSADSTDPIEFQDALTAVFVAVHATLVTRDGKLEVALGLGRMLADTILWSNNKEELERSFGFGRLGNAYEWLNDLHVLLPEHAADAVSGSLKRWEQYVAHEYDDPRPKNLTRLLHDQGALLKQLLRGDRSAVDLLRPSDYSLAAAGLARRFGIATLSYARRWSLLLLPLAIGTYFLIHWIVTSAPPDTRLIGVIATSLTVAGISWKTIGATLGRMLKMAELPLWNAEVKEAIIRSSSRYLDKVGRFQRARGRVSRSVTNMLHSRNKKPAGSTDQSPQQGK